MANLSAIREKIADRVDTINGLHVNAVWPDKLNCPAAIVNVESWDYRQSMGNNNRITAEVLVLAAPIGQGMERAQAKLDAYLGDTGAMSIKAALEGDKTLGGIAQTLHVPGWQDYGEIEFNGISYLGVRVIVEVWC